jgi:hypothetical protein
VLHVRNLPPEATEEEVLELCRPFGRVMRIRMMRDSGQNNQQVGRRSGDEVSRAWRMGAGRWCGTTAAAEIDGRVLL